MKINLNALFLMSVLLLGITGYPSSQLTSDNNLDVNNDVLLSFPNLAYADKEDDEYEDKEHEDDEHDEGEGHGNQGQS